VPKTGNAAIIVSQICSQAYWITVTDTAWQSQA